jgi:sorting nexin-1/2
MQLDAEDNEDAFYKPPVEPVARPANERRGPNEGSTESEAAALLTAEEED